MPPRQAAGTIAGHKGTSTASASPATASFWPRATATGASACGRENTCPEASLAARCIVAALTFSRDGATLLRAARQRPASVGSGVGQRISKHPHQDAVRAVAFSPDGQLLATASLDGHYGYCETAERTRSFGGTTAASRVWHFHRTAQGDHRRDRQHGPPYGVEN